MTESNYNIQVEVQPAYIADQSDPQNENYVFSYTVTISNVGDIPAKLLTRHWIITDGDGQVQEVMGDGVIIAK